MYKLVLAFRYMFKRRISYLALAAVGLCVFVVVVVMTVMTGLVVDFRQKNHEFAGDCVVGTDSLVGFGYYEEFIEILEQSEFVEAVSPVVKGYALVSGAGSERNYGFELMGVDADRHSAVTGFGRALHYHQDDWANAFRPSYEPNLPGFVAGIDIWLERDLRSKYTHPSEPTRRRFSVSCFPLTAKGALARAGTDVVRTRTFYFSDTSHSGLAKVDGAMIYIPFEWAQQLSGMGGAVKRASAIHIKFTAGTDLSVGCAGVNDLWEKFKAGKQNEKAAALLETVRVQNWKDYRRQFIAAMEKEQVMLTIMFALAGTTTVFVVFVVFYMIVSHKSKDIGILKSVGASDGSVAGLFRLFAVMMGLSGSVVGSLAGWLFLTKINDIENWLFERFGFQLWDRTVYAIGAIPNRLEPGVLAIVCACAVLACMAGAYLPSRRAAVSAPAAVLQVNQL